MVQRFTGDGIRAAVGAVPGVSSVEADTLKPGVARVRVVGGDPAVVRTVVGAIRPAGTRVVIEHRASAGATPTEMFL